MLSPTAKVILGMVRLGRRTGYEIKQLVDVSTRFFWAASYGQIYPELKRLEDDGLLSGSDASVNGRQRRAFSLTSAGEAALDEWLRSDEPLVNEMRNEGVLKLFFSSGLPVEERLALVRQMRTRHEEVHGSLCAREDIVRTRGGGPYTVLQYGIALQEFHLAWLAELDRELEAEAAAC
jgi:PadR family transcriptional regulator, regulatory protein AphA